MLVKLSFRELSDSKSSGLCTFDNIAISLSSELGQHLKGRLRVHETPILEVIFVSLTENPFDIITDALGSWKYLHHGK